MKIFPSNKMQLIPVTALRKSIRTITPPSGIAKLLLEEDTIKSHTVYNLNALIKTDEEGQYIKKTLLKNLFAKEIYNLNNVMHHAIDRDLIKSRIDNRRTYLEEQGFLDILARDNTILDKLL